MRANLPDIEWDKKPAVTLVAPDQSSSALTAR
jgi:hypothetical protein